MDRQAALSSCHKSLENILIFCLANSVDVRAISSVAPAGYCAVMGEIFNKKGLLKKRIVRETITISNFALRDDVKIDIKHWGGLLVNAYTSHKTFIANNHLEYCSKMYGSPHSLITYEFSDPSLIPIAGTPGYVELLCQGIKNLADFRNASFTPDWVRYINQRYF